MTSQPLNMNDIQYVGPHIHYTCDITATNLCHHSHSSDNIIHTLYDIRLWSCMASFALYKTSHPLFMTSSYPFYDIRNTIFDIVSTISVSSDHLYGCYHTNWFLRSHLLYMSSSYPLYMTSQPLNMCHHTHTFNYIAPFVCRRLHPLYI